MHEKANILIVQKPDLKRVFVAVTKRPRTIEVPAAPSLQNPGKRMASTKIVRATVKAESNGRNGLHELSKTALTVREMDSYFMRNPSSPAAVRRPHLYLEGATFVALLGPNVEEGIVGLGMTIEAAFRAFDFQYLKKLRPADAKLQMAEPLSLDRASGE
ncbi:MAG: hypothetical protein DLM68_09470 [Hyphomicrobiales bacterium]|nr:MAG: hypothetical protein DLM68_09470 [Hyphomicrobiales bacterium]